MSDKRTGKHQDDEKLSARRSRLKKKSKFYNMIKDCGDQVKHNNVHNSKSKGRLSRTKNIAKAQKNANTIVRTSTLTASQTINTKTNVVHSGNSGRVKAGVICKSDKNQSKNFTKVKVELPADYCDVSSNWRKLQKVLYKNRPEQLKKKLPKKVATQPDETEERPITCDKSDDVWFDGVDEFLIDTSEKEQNSVHDDSSNKCLTPCVAMDCEMVGVGYAGKESIVARVSIVNQYGGCLLDRYVKPREDVADYRTHVSGITPQHVSKAFEFRAVQKEVCDILEGRILIGHAIKNDLKVLFLSHPRKMIRDTSRYKPSRRLFNGKTPSLKALSKHLLGVTIQSGQHNSVEDARAAMKLYTLVHKKWENGRAKRPAQRVANLTKFRQKALLRQSKQQDSRSTVTDAQETS